MTIERSLQEQVDVAFDNYLTLSEVLRSDLERLLDEEREDEYWRRNFIRASAALIEGYAHCLREICIVGLACEAPELSAVEKKVLLSESACSANERVKRTLKATYKLLELSRAPDFGGTEWPNAQQILDKRHLLMHPKKPQDLEVPDELWKNTREGVGWLLKQFVTIFEQLQHKHGKSN